MGRQPSIDSYDITVKSEDSCSKKLTSWWQGLKQQSKHWQRQVLCPQQSQIWRVDIKIARDYGSAAWTSNTVCHVHRCSWRRDRSRRYTSTSVKSPTNQQPEWDHHSKPTAPTCRLGNWTGCCKQEISQAGKTWHDIEPNMRQRKKLLIPAQSTLKKLKY